MDKNLPRTVKMHFYANVSLKYSQGSWKSFEQVSAPSWIQAKSNRQHIYMVQKTNKPTNVHVTAKGPGGWFNPDQCYSFTLALLFHLSR